MGGRGRQRIQPKAKSIPTSLPLDPPPFFLEDEIVLPSRGLGLYALLVGLLILIALRLLFPVTGLLPSLSQLMVISVGTVAIYLFVRFFGYWIAWVVVIRSYPASGGIHPAARGELPRNVFLVVLLLPIGIFVPICAIYCWKTSGFPPEMWLVVSLVISLSVRDVIAVSGLVFNDGQTWIKESDRGLDVLRPTSSLSERR
ncbi:MAG: hypothetical protein AB1733_01055 [Thermodesulfobacteriota bacterium]